MLDTSRGIPMGQLLSTPTILEMESIGNDDEKTFLIGALPHLKTASPHVLALPH
ncbi:MAG: hypothetical protein H0V70_05515 [Ktedonobacteraceae bacterium]|nr:hypothetical protein [Ktedonobacteraceae bacterium]